MISGKLLGLIVLCSVNSFFQNRPDQIKNGHAIQKPRTIRANSRIVSIRDGQDFQKGIWQISPNVRPDIYLANRFKKSNQITFYTDIDSISFRVVPEQRYNFIMLLGKDSAYTQISTVTQPPYSLKRLKNHSETDTIPFNIGKDDKIYIKGKVNHSVELTLMFDTGSNQEVISGSGLAKGAKLNFSDLSSSASLGGVNRIEQSKNNELQIAGLTWSNVPFVRIDNADADGIVGYRIFDGKMVEIDYDKQLLIVHNDKFVPDRTYEQLPMHFKNQLFFINVTLKTGRHLINTSVEFDTGSNGSIWINNSLVRSKNLTVLFPPTGENRINGLDGQKIYNTTAVIPVLEISRFKLPEVPMSMAKPSQAVTLDWAIIGMDVLKRFHTMLDFKNDIVYLKPNKLITVPYQKDYNIKALITGISLILIIGLGIIYLARRRNVISD